MDNAMPSAVAPMSKGPRETEPNKLAVSGDLLAAAGATSSAGITSEIMAVIQTAAAAFLGRKVVILSVKAQSHLSEGASFWTSQGRDILQASHNVVQRGH
jgi:hypothetical protein